MILKGSNTVQVVNTSCAAGMRRPTSGRNGKPISGGILQKGLTFFNPFFLFFLLLEISSSVESVAPLATVALLEDD